MPGLDLISSDPRRRLLVAVKRAEHASLDHLVESIGLARSTTREHMAALENDGLVVRSFVRRGRGRPSARYALTEKGRRLFPSRDADVLQALLQFLQVRERHDLIEDFFEGFWRERLTRVTMMPEGASLAHRLGALERQLEEEGFMPEIIEDEEGLTIRECNCPFPASVRETRIPCRLEARFIEEALGRELERVTYMPDGHATCSYTLQRGDTSIDEPGSGRSM
jgi:predicted ArsR family transcriptional regulator